MVWYWTIQINQAFNVIGYFRSMMCAVISVCILVTSSRFVSLLSWFDKEINSAMIVMKSCCCCSNRNGAIIISILYLVFFFQLFDLESEYVLFSCYSFSPESASLQCLWPSFTRTACWNYSRSTQMHLVVCWIRFHSSLNSFIKEMFQTNRYDR